MKEKIKSGKLISLLKSLTKREARQLQAMIGSSFFGVSEKGKALLEHLLVHFPDFEELNQDEILTDLKFNDEKSLRYAMSELSGMIEEFLFLKEIKLHPEDKNHYLLKALIKKDLIRFAPPLIRKNKQILQKKAHRDDHYYLQSFQTEKDHYEYVASRRNIAVQKNLKDIILNLDIYYIINKLKLSAEMINLSEAWAVEYDPVMLNEILHLLKSSEDIHTPAVHIYYEIVKMLTATPSEPHYFNLKELLARHGSLFPREELNDMYIFARNYCAQKINSGESNYLYEVFDLYRMLLRDRVLLVNEHLSQWDYKNIVAVALRLGEYDWARDFIRTYKEKLRPEERQNAYFFNLANYYYYCKEYEETMLLIRDVEFTDTYYHLDCKVLLLKSYYELGEIQALQSLIDSFYMYLKRNKAISEFQRSSYLNFLRIVRKLVRMKPDDDQKRAALMLELDRSHPIANVSWLKEKLENISI